MGEIIRPDRWNNQPAPVDSEDDDIFSPERDVQTQQIGPHEMRQKVLIDMLHASFDFGSDAETARITSRLATLLGDQAVAARIVEEERLKHSRYYLDDNEPNDSLQSSKHPHLRRVK